MRRIVTGQDERGEPTVLLDDEPPRLVDTDQAKAWEIWITDDTPPDLRDAKDTAQRRPWSLVPPEPRGTAFRLIEFHPGGSSGMHSTDTLDYVVILSGQITLTTGGQGLVLGPGDVVVQRGAPHDWTNHTAEPCFVAVVLVSSPAS
jgi:quercetin dioxygenase-like cupin family protein